MANQDTYEVEKLKRERMAAKSAELTIAGVGLKKQHEMLAQEFDLTLSRRQVERLRQHAMYKRVLTEYTEGLVKSAIAELKLGVSKLIPKVLTAIENALEADNMQAVPHALKILGVTEEEPQKQAQAIQVIMPGAKAPKEIDVTGDSK